MLIDATIAVREKVEVNPTTKLSHVIQGDQGILLTETNYSCPESWSHKWKPALKAGFHCSAFGREGTALNSQACAARKYRGERRSRAVTWELNLLSTSRRSARANKSAPMESGFNGRPIRITPIQYLINENSHCGGARRATKFLRFNF